MAVGSSSPSCGHHLGVVDVRTHAKCVWVVEELLDEQTAGQRFVVEFVAHAPQRMDRAELGARLPAAHLVGPYSLRRPDKVTPSCAFGK